jgi:hypothetical protein
MEKACLEFKVNKLESRKKEKRQVNSDTGRHKNAYR